jgi:hypothetical protein
MFPFVASISMVAALSQGDALVFSAALAAIPATILAGVAAYNARMNFRQMHPNGGSSMRDAIDSIAADVKGVKGDVHEVKEDVRSIRDDQRSDHERITRLENQ